MVPARRLPARQPANVIQGCFPRDAIREAVRALFLLLLLSALPLLCRAQQSQPNVKPAAAYADAAPAYSLPPAKLHRAEALDRDHTLMWAAATIWSVLSLLIVLRLHWAAALSRMAARVSRRPWLQGLVFVPLLTVLLTLLDLPLSIAGHHVGLAYGLSVERWPAWLWDWTKGLLVNILGSTLVLSLLFAIVRRARRLWWLWFWLLSLPLMLAAVYAVPLVIDPLFNHFEPLARAHPELVAQLEQVVRRSGQSIPPERMFLMNASEKVTGLNAYVTGFGASKRVVVWDTSLQKSTPDEVLFIFGHELGHYVLHDVVHGLLLGAAGTLLGLWLGFHAVHWLLRRYGAGWRVPAVEDWSAVAVLLLAFAVFSVVSEPIANAISRRVEHRADVFGQEILHDIVANPQGTAVRSFQRLGEESLDVPHPNAFMVFWTYSHPTVAARAAFARDYNPWLPGRHPRFFSNE
jgi:STE24 endopeptidase